jgi:colanic acid biosynthesis glycosyl transferase WcaI
MKRRILIHDYAGHPFQVQLSRELARRGHDVLHLFAGHNQTPRGLLQRTDQDPVSFVSRPIYIREPLQKYAFFKRWQQEREYGQLLASEIQAFRPDVMISSNTPIDAQFYALRAAKTQGVPFVFWLQDVIGMATHKILQQKLPVIGGWIGQYYIRFERRLLQRSEHIVLITEDYQPLLNEWGIERTRTTVISNWAPIEILPVLTRNNIWSQQHDLDDKFVFMYTGTLGIKHNPDLLLQLALQYQDDYNIRMVVISEGPGADWLLEKKTEYCLASLQVLPFQPFEQLPQVMAVADVLVALLGSDAGIFSVPSKVLTYLCAQRPLLLAVPPENLAARIVSQYHAGIVVHPDDVGNFIAGAGLLMNNPALRNEYAINARAYAEDHFDIKKICDRFEEIISNKFDS